MGAHAIPNVSECANFHTMEILCGRPYRSQAVGLLGNQKLLGNPNDPQSMSRIGCHTMGILYERLLDSCTMDFDKKLIELDNPHSFQIRETAIPGSTFGTEQTNRVKLYGRRNVWDLFLCVFNCYCQLFEGRLDTGLMIFPNLKFF